MGSSPTGSTHAFVAQRIEQRSTEPCVAGSSPVKGTSGRLKLNRPRRDCNTPAGANGGRMTPHAGRLFLPMSRQCRYGVTGHLAALSRRRFWVRVPVSVRCRMVVRHVVLWECPKHPACAGINLPPIHPPDFPQYADGVGVRSRPLVPRSGSMGLRSGSPTGRGNGLRGRGLRVRIPPGALARHTANGLFVAIRGHDASSRGWNGMRFF